MLDQNIKVLKFLNKIKLKNEKKYDKICYIHSVDKPIKNI